MPIFRDAQTGYWAQFRLEDMATEENFRAHPQRVQAWYQYRRRLLAEALPNAGHRALAEFASAYPDRLALIPQNVDGLHQRAGSSDVLCLHGDIFVDRWLDMPCSCCHVQDAAAGSPPYCDRCGNLLRPGMVWFGEPLPFAALEADQNAARRCDVILVLVLGTAGAVYPAAGLAKHARTAGAQVVVVNTAPSALDDTGHAVLRGEAGAVLSQVLDT